ncbi:MAG: hypothetical protein ACREXR_22125, partial [Gammaproteobacteria bacterium]
MNVFDILFAGAGLIMRLGSMSIDPQSPPAIAAGSSLANRCRPGIANTPFTLIYRIDPGVH